MDSLLELIIYKADNGRRLRDVLRSNMHVSRGFLRRLANRGVALVNGVDRHLSDKVYTGDRVLLQPGAASQPGVVPEPMPIDLVYDDAHLTLVNKPAGMVVHPARQYTAGTLANAVAYHMAPEAKFVTVRPVHRLDAGTSGLILFARHAHAHYVLSKQMEAGTFCRWYVALVAGAIAQASSDWQTIHAPIARVAGHPVKRQVAEDGQEACTQYRVLFVGDKVTCVELRLLTGRTHQVRVHMAHLGHPLVGDELYGGSTLLNRPALHSYRLLLRHPITQVALDFRTEPPTDMLTLMRSQAPADSSSAWWPS